MGILNGIDIVVNRADVLKTLKTNRNRHMKIVEEAQAGFVEKAQVVLGERIAAFKEGKKVNLQFDIFPPRNYTRVYDTAIQMFELAVNDTITLDDRQIANLVMDNWDWKRTFLSDNALFSVSARADAQGYDDGGKAFYE